MTITDLTIRDLCRQAWAMAEAKGFHEGQPADRTHTLLRFCLIHSEVSEAVQVVKRHGVGGDVVRGVLAEELADVLIRLGDLAGGLGLDLTEAVQAKMGINAQRPHGYGTPAEGVA